MEERYLSLSEAADALDISERTAYRWIKSGKLRAFKPGRDYRIPEVAIREAVEESEVRPKGESRSSLEPSLFNGLEDERPFVAVEGMVGLLERWHARRLAEAQDPSSPYFRDATSAALWITGAREEANEFCLYLSEWVQRHPDAFGSVWDALHLFGASLVLDNPAELGERRLREMAGKPDELAARRMERATAELRASSAQLQERGRAANG